MSTRASEEMEQINQIKTREQRAIQRAEDKARRAKDSQARADRAAEKAAKALRKAEAVRREAESEVDSNTGTLGRTASSEASSNRPKGISSDS